MAKQKIYWFCQIFGWSLLLAVEYLGYLFEDGFDVDVLYLAIANIFLGITLTHLYRLMIRRWNWVRLPFFQIAPARAAFHSGAGPDYDDGQHAHR